MRLPLLFALAVVGCVESDEDGVPLARPEVPAAIGIGWDVYPQKDIGSPVPDPTGIAFDGEQLWLISGGHNAMTHRLVRYDDRRLEITREFTFSNLIEQLGTGVYGISWDGSHIWIGVSGNTNKLVAVNPYSGMIERTWGSPAMYGPTDLTFDGAQLWIGSGNGTLYAIDRDSGSVLSSFPVGEAFVRDNGIVALEGQILVNALFGEGLALFSDTGTLITRHPRVLGPMCFARGQIVSLDSGSILYNTLE